MSFTNAQWLVIVVRLIGGKKNCNETRSSRVLRFVETPLRLMKRFRSFDIGRYEKNKSNRVVSGARFTSMTTILIPGIYPRDKSLEMKG